MALRIYFLRHGRPENEECLRGIEDFALTQEGFEQMAKSYGHIEDKLDFIISSPLSRCATFAEYVAEKSHVPLQIDDNWRELSFGDWGGRPHKELQEKYPAELAGYWKNPWDNTPPNGEKLIHASQRVNAAFEEIVKNYKEKNILIVTHSAVMRMMMMRFLDINPRSNGIFSGIHLPYATLMTVDIHQTGSSYKSHFLWPNTAF